MDPELKKILRENIYTSRENNKMLKKLLRHQRWGQVFRVLYWVTIIGAALGLFYFVQPYVQRVTDTYNSVAGTFEQTAETTSRVNSIFKRDNEE